MWSPESLQDPNGFAKVLYRFLGFLSLIERAM